MKINTDTFRYFVRVRQKDADLPYLLMLHGFMGSSNALRPLVKYLKPFCNPVTIDLAGHGKTKSSGDPEQYTAEQQVKQLEQVLDELGYDRPFIYGYSMGGRLAFQLMKAFPERFSGALIESAHCGIFSEAEREKRKQEDQEKADALINDFGEFILNWQKQSLFYVPGSEPDDHYEDIMRRQNPEWLRASLLGFGAGTMPPVCNDLTDIELPATLLAGEYDKKYCRIMAKIAKLNPGFTFVKAEQAAHRVHRDNPEALVMELRLLIERNQIET